MAVTSLYTSIPNHEGITSVRHTLIEKGYDSQVSVQSNTQLLKYVLHMNNFEFNNSTYLQTGGTSMGTCIAPSLANLFMGKHEEKLSIIDKRIFNYPKSKQRGQTADKMFKLSFRL